MACHHLPRTANTVERRRAWNAIIAFGQHTRPNDVGHCIISSLLNSTHYRTALGVACPHRLRAAYTVERRQAWLAIIALGWKTRSNDVRRGMPSLPLDSTHSQTTSGMKCNHRVWIIHTVERRREWLPSSPLDSTYDRTTSSVACHHRLWAAHTVERCWAGHAITNYGQLTRSNDIGQ